MDTSCCMKTVCFCEFAIFEAQELANIPFEAGRIVWKADGVAAEIANSTQPAPCRTEEWLLGECLTNLYVGLLRDQRGEKVAAQTHDSGLCR